MSQAPLSHAERGGRGGQRRAENLTAAERSEIARAGALAANSPAGRARSIVKAWSTLTAAEKREVRDILRAGGVIPT